MCSNIKLTHRLNVNIAFSLLSALVRFTRLVLNGPSEECPTRKTCHGTVVDVLGGRLEADLAFFGRRDQRVRLLFAGAVFSRFSFRFCRIEFDPFRAERVVVGGRRVTAGRRTSCHGLMIAHEHLEEQV